MNTPCSVAVTDYRVLFHNDKYPGSGSSCVYTDGALILTVQKASDAARGISASITHSSDMGATWADPLPIGPRLERPQEEFQGVSLAHVLDDGTVVAVGVHLPSGYDPSSGSHGLYRPGEVLVGHRPRDAADFTWQSHPSGTFSVEQFVAPGIMLPSGRLVCTLWGSPEKDANWQCGVLLSDDGGRTFRYRVVGAKQDRAIRNRPEVVAGYNEQTLFAASDHQIVSIIRGRDHLGGIPGTNPRSSECLFSRSVSTDGGETWSEPALTNLPGTGAPSDGLVLPDGSLLLPARIPTVWSRHDEWSLCGLLMARSFDGGLSWRPELVFEKDPDGEYFDNYYNAMNGTFVRIAEDEYLYVFGHHRPKQDKGNRVLAVQLQITSHVDALRGGA